MQNSSEMQNTTPRLHLSTAAAPSTTATTTAGVNCGGGVVVPTVDLRRDGCGGGMVKACEEVGMFKVSNHGFPMELLEKVHAHAAFFFSLSLEEKLKNHGLGYGHSEIGRRGDLGHLQYLLLDANPTSPPPSPSPLFQPHFDFRCVMSEYVKEIKKMAIQVLEVMAEGLELGERTTLSKLLTDGDNDCIVRINEYPPCPDYKESVVGFGEHTDPQIISILTSNGVSGFQFKNKVGTWSSLSSDPDAFFVIVGDSLQVMTNGRFRSLKHRVVVEKGEERCDRVSVIYFVGPPLEEKIAPLPCLVERSGGASLYRGLTWGYYKTHCFSSKLVDDRLIVFEKTIENEDENSI